MTFQKRFPNHCVGLKETENTDEESTILGLCNLRLNGGGRLPVPGSNPDGDDAPTPNTSNMDPSEFPVQVLPYLYLGNAQNSADLECLYKNNIKYILNVTPNVPNTFETDGAFKYMQIPIVDHWSQNLSTWFPKAISFIGRYLMFLYFLTLLKCCYIALQVKFTVLKKKLYASKDANKFFPIRVGQFFLPKLHSQLEFYAISSRFQSFD